MKLNEGDFSLGTASIHFCNKPCQKIVFKSQLNSVALADLHMPTLISFPFTCLGLLLQWSWKMPIIKVIEIF